MVIDSSIEIIIPQLKALNNIITIQTQAETHTFNSHRTN